MPAHFTPNFCYPSRATEGRGRLEENQVWLGRMQPWLHKDGNSRERKSEKMVLV